MLKRFAILILCISFLCVPVRAEAGEKLVALTFDDGPSGRFTRKLLDGLAQRGTKATFLLCGYRMEQDPDLTQRIFQEGHEIGLHGHSHKPMKGMCQRDVAQEIRKAMELLPAGCDVSFLRPPGGLCSGCVETVAEEFSLSVLSWSINPRDWAIDDAKSIENAVLRHVRDGDVILMHDMSDSSVDAAFSIIDELQARGFRFVTASQLAQARNTQLIPGKTYTRFETPDS